jgi:predicted nucleic acid-binding protein
MIVYIETNFLLEVAYLQEEHGSCHQLLAIAEAGQVNLVLPAFSAIEAKLSLARQARRRDEFRDRLQRELRELSRSDPYTEILEKTKVLTDALTESVTLEQQRLQSALSRLFKIGHIIPLQISTVQTAARFELALELSTQDSIILASVIEDLPTRPKGTKCFLNRNAKDFADPAVYDELNKHDCKMIPSFKHGHAYILNVLPPAP